jgi:hypothetical protein
MIDPVDAFFAEYPPGIQEICRVLRAMVLDAMPQAVERLYESQDHVSYQLTQAARDGLVYVCPLRDYVRLGFFYGGSLPDPGGVLIGTGKRLRHVKVYNAEAAREPVL